MPLLTLLVLLFVTFANTAFTEDFEDFPIEGARQNPFDLRFDFLYLKGSGTRLDYDTNIVSIDHRDTGFTEIENKVFDEHFGWKPCFRLEGDYDLKCGD